MKNINIFLLIFVIIAISCDNEVRKKENLYCDNPTGDSVKNQSGRIYKWTDNSSENFFYYIGNPDPKLKGTGFIPCNEIPKNLKTEVEVGALIIYSGIIKLGSDAEEPLYFGIELMEIRKAEN